MAVSTNPPWYASCSRAWELDAASDFEILLILLTSLSIAVSIPRLVDAIRLFADEELVGTWEDKFVAVDFDFATLLSFPFCSCILFAIVLVQLIKLEFLAQQVHVWRPDLAKWPNSSVLVRSCACPALLRTGKFGKNVCGNVMSKWACGNSKDGWDMRMEKPRNVTVNALCTEKCATSECMYTSPLPHVYETLKNLSQKEYLRLHHPVSVLIFSTSTCSTGWLSINHIKWKLLGFPRHASLLIFDDAFVWTLSNCVRSLRQLLPSWYNLWVLPCFLVHANNGPRCFGEALHEILNYFGSGQEST